MSYTSRIKSTRMVARGYTKASIVCYDCDQATASYMTVNRDLYGDGSSSAVLVHRTGAGCHKGVDSSAIYSGTCQHAA